MKRFFIAVALTVACAPAFAQEVVGYGLEAQFPNQTHQDGLIIFQLPVLEFTFMLSVSRCIASMPERLKAMK